MQGALRIHRALLPASAGSSGSLPRQKNTLGDNGRAARYVAGLHPGGLGAGGAWRHGLYRAWPFNSLIHFNSNLAVTPAPELPSGYSGAQVLTARDVRPALLAHNRASWEHKSKETLRLAWLLPSVSP